MCSRDPHCDQEGCPYKHTVSPIHNVKCHFDPKCTNLKCPFKHTIPPEIVKKLQDQENLIKKLTTKLTSMPTIPPIAAAAGVPGMSPAGVVAAPCRNGFACKGRADKSCHFAHPRIKCAHRDDKSCKFGVSCRYSHAPDCKYGSGCTKIGCTFAHPGDEPINNDVNMTSSAPVINGSVVPAPPTAATAAAAVPAATATYVDPLAPVPGAMSMPIPLNNENACGNVSINVNEVHEGKQMCPDGENCMDPECPYEHPNSGNTGVSII